MDEVFGLFPVPVMRAPRVLGDRLVGDLTKYFSGRASPDRSASQALSHTEMLRPGDNPLFVEAADLITPKLDDMGALMFGQRLGWNIKEMWVNVLDLGGMQVMHTHANSFVSGIVYLTPCHPESQTVFIKSGGGTEFRFRNENEEAVPGHFNAERWVSPPPSPGDLLLFPSYLMHAVPPNMGERRITMSFNAIPKGLDAWGYKITFGGT
jgi:hypothetical protein